MPRVKVTVPFLDAECNRVRMIGHTFDCDAARAAGLVDAGLAEPAEGAQAWPPCKGNLVGELLGEDGPQEGEPSERQAELGEGDAEPTRAQLAARCDELGVSYPARANKAKLKQLIEQAEAGE